MNSEEVRQITAHEYDRRHRADLAVIAIMHEKQAKVREIVREELMRAFSDKLSMDEIANVAYAVETRIL